MSIQPQGPGWWQASDGRWYPPQPTQQWQQPAAYGPPPGGVPPGRQKSGRSGCVIAAVVVVVLVLAAGGVGAYLIAQSVAKVGGGILGAGGSSAASCPPASEISGIIDSPVKEPQAGSLVGSTGCRYPAAKEQSGLEVNIVIGPELVADDEIKSFVGEGQAAGAQPEPIPVGQRGQAWSSTNKSAAIAVGRGHLVLVEIMSAQSFAPIPDKKAGAVEIVRRLAG